MKKGFTLIELLAVIVILAIIALIATPIILGIINDAREESNERSVELYASAVRNGIAAYQLSGKVVAANTYNEETLPFEVEYEGNVVCEIIRIYSDGNVYLEGCKVNGSDKEYGYGIEEETPDTGSTQPSRYYSWSSGIINGELPDDAKQNVSDIDTKGYPFYLVLDVDSNNKVTAAHVCFVKNETEYCLKGADSASEVFAANKSALEDAFKDVENACSLEGTYFGCYEESLNVEASQSGHIISRFTFGECIIKDDGRFECAEH